MAVYLDFLNTADFLILTYLYLCTLEKMSLDQMDKDEFPFRRFCTDMGTIFIIFIIFYYLLFLYLYSAYYSVDSK